MSQPDAERWIDEERSRRQMRQAMLRYFWGADRGDQALHESCYTKDAKLFIDGVQRRGEGAPPASDQPAPLGVPVDRIIGTTHHLHQSDIRIEGETAYSESYATAHVLVREGDATQVLVRGLRYFDKFARVDGVWLIAERNHNLDWMYTMPAEFVKTRGERASFTQWLAGQGDATG